MKWHALDSSTYALGESPFWHPHEQALYWVDIVGKKILRTDVHGSSVQSWDMESEPGCIAPIAGGGWVIALRHGVFRARQWGGSLERIATLAYDSSTVRANDGKCDALGRFWVGTVDESKTLRCAALFTIDCRAGQPATIEHKLGNALTANGLAWSPDNGTLYWADTPSHAVHAWDYDLAGNALENRRLYLEMPAKPSDWSYEQLGYNGRPDGAAVDVQGNYYVAMYEGACVCKFAPGGTLLTRFPTPAVCPTMPCFGGEDLKTLYLTTARHGRSNAELQAFPQSGGVFSLRVDTPGLPVNFFVE